jgi:predicted MFS family arabinose efflux permease
LLIIGVALGALMAFLGMIIRERPGSQDVEPAAASVPPMHPPAENQSAASTINILTLLKIPQFWMMGLSVAVVLAGVSTLTISLVPIGRATGLTMLQATTLNSVEGGASIAGALLVAVIADRVERITLLSGLFLLFAALNSLLLLDGGFTGLIVSAVMLGICAGTITHTFYALLADRFGTASFGTVRGMSLVLISIVTMIAMRFAGEIFDRTGGYDAMFGACIAMSLAAAAFMFASRLAGRVPASSPAA